MPRPITKPKTNHKISITPDYVKKYNLDQRAVYYCILVASGVLPIEAAQAIYRDPTTPKAKERIKELTEDLPGVSMLIQTLKSDTDTKTLKLQDEITRLKDELKTLTSKRQKARGTMNKEDIIQELELILRDVSGKERAEVLMKLADLQQMKKENTNEIQRIYYYLPCKKLDASE